MVVAVANAWPGARAAAAGASPDGGHVATEAMLRASVGWLGLALMAWLLLWGAESATAVGLRPLPMRHVLAAACTVFVLAEAPMIALAVAWNLARTHVQGLAEHSGSSAHTTFLGDAVSSMAAGVSEEIVVLVVPVLAAWRLAQTISSPRLRRTGVIVVVVVLASMRLAYHIEYGLAVVQLAPWAIACVLLYLRSGAILPLMIAHVCYDLLAAVTNRISARHGLAAALTVFTAVTAIAAVTAFRQGRSVRRHAEQAA
ncbi:type II CAAX prenyl endopeptidase Rce1 family protein [Kitasatospora sp. NPDC059088]|uniref:CPBP family glutamic-type intramembrane protease n=1 Tax=Kitasatospora sp. NPDC059088 TaxID=3346722 RepID=UPI00368EAE19